LQSREAELGRWGKDVVRWWRKGQGGVGTIVGPFELVGTVCLGIVGDSRWETPRRIEVIGEDGGPRRVVQEDSKDVVLEMPPRPLVWDWQ